MNKIKIPGSAIFGIFLIAIGVISLLSSMDIIESYDVFTTFWPLILVLFGLKAVIDHRSNTFFGLILTLIGALLLLDRLGYTLMGGLELGDMIIPIIVILIGLNFILPSEKRKNKGVVDDTPVTPRPTPPPTPTPPTPPPPTPPPTPTPPTPPTPPEVEVVKSDDITIE